MYRYLYILCIWIGVLSVQAANTTWQFHGQADVLTQYINREAINKNNKNTLLGSGNVRFKVKNSSTSFNSYYGGAEAHVVGMSGLSDELFFKKNKFGDSLYRLAPLTWYLNDETKVQSRIYVDRLFASFRYANGRLLIGRQPITFGKDFFWTPLDIFRPFTPAQLDRDYKSGTDAINFNYTLNYTTGVQLIYAAGKTTPDDNVYSWTGSALIARGYTNVLDWDFSVLGGKRYAAYTMGLGISGDIKGVQVRGEGSYFWPEGSLIQGLKNGYQYVLGTSYSWPNTLEIQFEYFHDSYGQSNLKDNPLSLVTGALARYQFIPNFSKDLAGGSISYNFIPIVTGRFSTIVSLNDGSVFLQPDVLYSVLSNLDLVAAVMFGIGDKMKSAPGMPYGSEFGNVPTTVYLQAKLYW